MSVRARRSLPAFAALAGLVLAGCDRAAEAPGADAPQPATPVAATPAPPQAPAAVAGDGVDATRVVDHAPVAGAGDGFDVRAFAGSFEADGLQVAFAADGTYALVARAESAGADLESTGSWTVEDDGTRIRLDPDSKDEPDRVFAVVSPDELAAADGGQVLRRAGD